MNKAIIFDMDGTLFQTNLILESALEDIFKHKKPRQLDNNQNGAILHFKTIKLVRFLFSVSRGFLLITLLSYQVLALVLLQLQHLFYGLI